ncbi:MAG: alpha-isopropylmalate synthase regulatory domain-containing protein [Myxococcota bacterium]
MRAEQGPLQTKALQTMREVLGEEFRTLEVRGYEISEDFGDGHCTITCKAVENPGERAFSVDGKGVGMLDAFFSGLRERYQGEFPSLGSIRFSSFSVRGLMGDANAEQATDAQAEATVGVTNSSNTEFHFTALSPSVSHSSMEAVLAAVEYFVNSEQAYVRIYKALQHHKTSGRPEMVARYTELLAEMVRNTSYSSAVERLQAQE